MGNLSLLGTVEMKETSSSYNLFLTSTGLVIVEAWVLRWLLLIWCLQEAAALPWVSCKRLWGTGLIWFAKLTPASRHLPCLRPLQKNINPVLLFLQSFVLEIVLVVSERVQHSPLESSNVNFIFGKLCGNWFFTCTRKPSLSLPKTCTDIPYTVYELSRF